jgi:hypothetical protein
MADMTDPSMTVSIKGDSTPLEKTLKDAEKKVDASGRSMGSAVEKNLTDVANKLGNKIAKMIGAGFAIKALDDSLKIIADGIKYGKGANDIALAIGDSILEGLRRVPVAGALGDILAMVFDPLLGDPKKVEEARKKYGESQMQARAREDSLRRIQMIGATPEEAIRLKAEKDIRDAQDELEKALSTIQATGERPFDKIGFEKAVDDAIRAAYPGMDPSQMSKSDRARIAETIDRSKFEMAAGYTPEAQAEMKRLTDATRRAEEVIRARAEEEIARLAAKTEPKEEGEPVISDIEMPDVGVEDAVDELHDSIVEQGSEAIFSDTRMIGLATDTLTEIKELRKLADRFVTQNVGLR